MAPVAIVTDNSADLSAEQVAAHGIREVPLTVTFGDESFVIGTELSNEDFYARLTAPGAPFPRTAAPSPALFEAAFSEALDEGADGVVCLTLSKELSATFANASLGAKGFDAGRVEVVDSMTTTVGQGLLVLAAAAHAASGADVADVVRHVTDLRSRSRIYFGVETLEYLRRGGRIGRASALLGSLLSMKPILTVTDGVVEAADRRRTTPKAKARLLELCAEHPVERAVVLHTMTPGIEGFADQLAARLGLDRERVVVGLTGPVAGSHVGPGVYGAALIRAS